MTEIEQRYSFSVLRERLRQHNGPVLNFARAAQIRTLVAANLVEFCADDSAAARRPRP